MATDHNIRQLIINKVPTKAQYDQMVKNADELYLTPDDSNGLPDQTGQSGKYLTTNGSTASWASVPAGTVTSVRVQAGTGLSSSQSTAQTSTLNTTISIASGYKLPTTTEWSGKQDTISDLATIRSGAEAGATAVQPGDLATVATSGSYNDLTNKPTIPAAQVNSDWNATSGVAQILNKPTSISGYGITDAYTKTEIDGMISSVYKPAGSVAFASLPTLSDNVLGNVYNVTDAFTTTTDFVEGSGKSYPAGTNVVVVNTGTSSSPTYKFDVLSGFVDLSGYVPTSRKVNGKALSADISLTASDVGAISSHQSIKTLKTDNTTAQSTSSSETIAGSGTINLHKVSKTGSYNDLNNKPTIPATNVIPTTTTANKVLVSTTTSGTAKWSDFSTAGLLKTNTSGVISVDTTSYGTYSKPSGGIPASDLAESYYLASNPSGYTSNAGTVTSVQVQAGTGLTSSTSTAQTTTLNTTIGVDSNYKLPTTTEWNGKQNTINDLGYIRNQAAKVDDKISAIDVTDSGSSLPAASGYNLNNTFVNKTDKKLYKVEAPAYVLNSSVYKSDAITVNLTTGLATGFSTTSNPGGTWTTYMSNSYNTSIATAPIYVHFKTGSTLPGYNQYIFLNYTPASYYSTYFGVAGSTTLSLVCTRYITSTGQIESVFSYPLFDTVLETNTEYYLYLEYNNGEYIATLSSTGYNINILETSSIEESTTPSCTTFYYGGINNRYTTFNGMSVYLLDSTGNFLVADGALTWDSGTTLEDNTQYNDTTNIKTLYYNNNTLYDSGDSLPSQSGQSGKFLTTDGTSASWAAVSIPTVNNSTITIQKNSTTVDSFTLNQSSDKTINISVPTKTSDLNNDSGYTTNTGTVTSVQVQAGTGLASSTSTAQNTTLNTTISIASGYKLPTTTEWNNKQDVLPSQSGNNGKFLTTNGNTMSWSTVSSIWTYDSTNKILEIS